jgi:hypothetical protein
MYLIDIFQSWKAFKKLKVHLGSVFTPAEDRRHYYAYLNEWEKQKGANFTGMRNFSCVYFSSQTNAVMLISFSAIIRAASYPNQFPRVLAGSEVVVSIRRYVVSTN